jgi:hypothetical protein
MKSALFLSPVALTAVIVDILGNGASAAVIAGGALVIYGGFAAYRLGRTWEDRWTQLIREKQAKTSNDAREANM